MNMLETGITGRHEEVVTYELTAAKVGSGLVEVYATPMMIALMEKTCAQTVEPYLDEGDGTVGTLVNVTHSAATPVGMKVWCEAEITSVSENGKIVDFAVKAWDEKGPISSGTHQRAIINNERFLAKCNAKLEG